MRATGSARGPTVEGGRRSEASSRDSRSPPRHLRRPAASPHPVPKTLSASRPPPVLANGKVQVSRNVHEESRVANHAGGVRDVLRHLTLVETADPGGRSAAPVLDPRAGAAACPWCGSGVAAVASGVAATASGVAAPGRSTYGAR